MRSKQAAVTIHDVAQAAGVSVTTVSRVLNDKDDVAPETYEKVRRVMQELNYTASLAAKSMRSRTTNVIGLVLPDVTEPFDLEVIKGVGAAIRESKYDLMIYTGGSPPLKATPMRLMGAERIMHARTTKGRASRKTPQSNPSFGPRRA